MTPHTPKTTAPRSTRVTLLLAMGGALLLALPAAMAQSAPAVIVVTFSDDDKSVSVFSSKDISNVYVQVCGPLVAHNLPNPNPHKHDSLTGHYFNHTETLKIVGVYVKSGNNGLVSNDPPGAGQFFANAGVTCESTSTTTTTSDSETTTTSDNETTTTTSETDPPTEEVPFFGAPAVMGLGIAGAVGGALFMLRRRI